MESKASQIVVAYEGFWLEAEKLGKRDAETYPLERKELRRDRVERHLLGMMSMYAARYGDPEQRLQMVEFLEKQLFRVPPVEGEVCHLTLDMWKDLRKVVLSGEYVDLCAKEKEKGGERNGKS